MDATSYLRFFLALVVVIGLILAVTWVMKRLGVGQNQIGPMGRKRRLRTIETASIDARHRLVLFRRDAVEHLVLLGPTSTQVIESGIPAAPDDTASSDATNIATTFRNLLTPTPATKDSAP